MSTSFPRAELKVSHKTWISPNAAHWVSRRNLFAFQLHTNERAQAKRVPVRCTQSTRSPLLAGLITLAHCVTRDFTALFQHSASEFLKSGRCCGKFPVSRQPSARPCRSRQQPHKHGQGEKLYFLEQWYFALLAFGLSVPVPVESSAAILRRNTRIAQLTSTQGSSYFYCIVSPREFSCSDFLFSPKSPGISLCTPGIWIPTQYLHATVLQCTRAGWQFRKIKSKMIH